VTRSSIERWLAALVLGVVSTFATGVDAGPSSDPKESASALGSEGLKLHAAGRFAEAYDKFAAAERIMHSPVLLLWMARSQRALGRLRDARALLERVTEEELAAGASEKWRAARDDAAAELAILRRRIPTLTVRIVDSQGGHVSVDGRPVKLGVAQELDPGDHAVRVHVPRYAVVSARVHLDEGEHEVFAPELTEVERASGSIIPGAIGLGVGLTGVAAGAITGGLALKLAGEVEENCTGSACRPEDESKAGDAGTLAGVSTALFVGGGLVAAAGVVLLVVRPGKGDAVTTSLGPAGASMRLRF
jgi:hypothetical protein